MITKRRCINCLNIYPAYNHTCPICDHDISYIAEIIMKEVDNETDLYRMRRNENPL